MSSTKAWYRRYEWVLWTALLVGIVSLRWPMLKGWVYRAADTPAPAASFKWRTDLDSALAEARATGRLVFADFHAEWCPPCITMKNDVWGDPEVGRLLSERYVPLSIDVDRDPGAADRFKVRGIPTVHVLDADGKIVRTAYFMSRSGILDFLRKAAGNGE